MSLPWKFKVLIMKQLVFLKSLTSRSEPQGTSKSPHYHFLINDLNMSQWRSSNIWDMTIIPWVDLWVIQVHIHPHHLPPSWMLNRLYMFLAKWFIIFHQPRFPWNSRGFPFQIATFWGPNRSCFWSRFHLTRCFKPPQIRVQGQTILCYLLLGCTRKFVNGS